ncbi:HAD family hydrolase [Methanomethylovorans sp.]|uniref:HAD family hydrolase n=1 Tax=Methanomethylovorans sp. TaxID=2758717 RepID=UPI00345E6E5E
MLKTLIFDMDGVLVDSMPYHVEAMQHIFDQMGVYMDQQLIYEREGEKTIDIVRLLLEKAGTDNGSFDLEVIVERYIEEFNVIATLDPFVGMPECLEVLKHRYELAVVSGADKPIVHNVLNELYPDLFSVIVSGDDIDKGKPAPDPYLKAVELLSIQKDECIVIENAPVGVQAAKAAGLCCIAVPTYLEHDKLSLADSIVMNHDLLIDFLLDLRSDVPKTCIKRCAHPVKS